MPLKSISSERRTDVSSNNLQYLLNLKPKSSKQLAYDTITEFASDRLKVIQNHQLGWGHTLAKTFLGWSTYIGTCTFPIISLGGAIYYLLPRTPREATHLVQNIDKSTYFYQAIIAGGVIVTADRVAKNITGISPLKRLIDLTMFITGLATVKAADAVSGAVLDVYRSREAKAENVTKESQDLLFKDLNKTYTGMKSEVENQLDSCKNKDPRKLLELKRDCTVLEMLLPKISKSWGKLGIENYDNILNELKAILEEVRDAKLEFKTAPGSGEYNAQLMQVLAHSDSIIPSNALKCVEEAEAEQREFGFLYNMQQDLSSALGGVASSLATVAGLGTLTFYAKQAITAPLVDQIYQATFGTASKYLENGTIDREALPLTLGAASATVLTAGSAGYLVGSRIYQSYAEKQQASQLLVKEKFERARQDMTTICNGIASYLQEQVQTVNDYNQLRKTAETIQQKLPALQNFANRIALDGFKPEDVTKQLKITLKSILAPSSAA